MKCENGRFRHSFEMQMTVSQCMDFSPCLPDRVVRGIQLGQSYLWPCNGSSRWPRIKAIGEAQYS
jgi:hypothetical protein